VVVMMIDKVGKTHTLYVILKNLAMMFGTTIAKTLKQQFEQRTKGSSTNKVSLTTLPCPDIV
jgi:hypothetical protein